jgi:hypothetical protein
MIPSEEELIGGGKIWIETATRGRVCVQVVRSCEWIIDGLTAQTGCGGKMVPITSGEIPPEVRFCPFCGGEIIGSETATGLREPVTNEQSATNQRDPE